MMGHLPKIIYFMMLSHSSMVFSKDILQPLFKCDFENGFCNGLTTVGFAWRVNQDATIYDNTGPSKAANGNSYAYYEKEYTGSPTLTYTQATPPPSTSVVLAFNFHAYGNDIKSFSIIFRNENGDVIDTPYVINGQMQDSSFRPFIPILVNKNLTSVFKTLDFTVTSGSGKLSAYAIDDVVLSVIVYDKSAWTSWTSFGECSVSCGNGTTFRSRTCFSINDQMLSHSCIGNSTEIQECNIGVCPELCIVKKRSDCPILTQPINLVDFVSILDEQMVDLISNWISTPIDTSIGCDLNVFYAVKYRLNYQISVLIQLNYNSSLKVEKVKDIIGCLSPDSNSNIQQSILNFCEVAIKQNNFLNASLSKLHLLVNQLESAIGVCNGSVSSFWSEWGPWSYCSVSCDGGLITRKRVCYENSAVILSSFCIGNDEESLLCNTQKCSNVLCDVAKNVDCSLISPLTVLNPTSIMTRVSLDNVIAEISMWPLRISEELLKSCSLDLLATDLALLKNQMKMASAVSYNISKHIEQVRDMIVCSSNVLGEDLYKVCMSAVQSNAILNALVNQLETLVQRYQTAINTCKSCGFVCGILDYFMHSLLKTPY